MLIRNLPINPGCKVFTTSVLLQASYTAMSDVTLKGDLLTQNCTSVTVVKIWVWSLMLVYQIGERNYSRRMEKPPDSQTQHTFCNSIYTFHHNSILFPYNFYACTKRSCWNRRVSKIVTASSVETQVCAEGGGTADTQQWHSSSKPRNCANKLFKSDSIKTLPETVTANLSCCNTLLVETQINLMFN